MPKPVSELVATGNEPGKSHQGPVEPECSRAVGFKPGQLGNGQNRHFAAGKNGRWPPACLLLSAMLWGQLVSSSLPGKGMERVWARDRRSQSRSRWTRPKGSKAVWTWSSPALLPVAVSVLQFAKQRQRNVCSESKAAIYGLGGQESRQTWASAFAISTAP